MGRLAGEARELALALAPYGTTWLRLDEAIINVRPTGDWCAAQWEALPPITSTQGVKGSCCTCSLRWLRPRSAPQPLSRCCADMAVPQVPFAPRPTCQGPHSPLSWLTALCQDGGPGPGPSHKIIKSPRFRVRRPRPGARKEDGSPKGGATPGPGPVPVRRGGPDFVSPSLRVGKPQSTLSPQQGPRAGPLPLLGLSFPFIPTESVLGPCPASGT